jgi:hypothetical protein
MIRLTWSNSVADVNVVVQPAVGWAEQTCQACGKSRADYVEIHLRHSAAKIVLCAQCDDAQLSKPRAVRVTQGRE